MNPAVEPACGRCVDVIVFGMIGVFDRHDERVAYVDRLQARGGKDEIMAGWRFVPEHDLIQKPCRCAVCGSEMWGSGFPVSQIVAEVSE